MEINNIPLLFPREGDQWLMRLFVATDFGKGDLARLNRVRIHQHVLFLSDILGAGGKSLDKGYLQKQEANERWSRLRFRPKEKPPPKDFRLWREALLQLAPAGSISDRLQDFTSSGHKIWDWRYDATNKRILHQKADSMDI